MKVRICQMTMKIILRKGKIIQNRAYLLMQVTFQKQSKATEYRNVGPHQMI